MARALTRPGGLLTALVVLTVVFAGSGATQEAPPERPNVLVILTDDQDAASMGRMPKTQSLLVQRGTNLTRAFATPPVCCPSRASFLRGQYAHNHGTTKNWQPGVAADEGWEKFRSLGREESTVATWLDDAGYTTGYMGKYLNGYGNEGFTTHIPPGWDRFWGWQGNYGQYGGPTGRSYKINDNGEIKTYDGAKLHDTDYLAQKAEAFIGGRRTDSALWMLWVAPNPPHTPSHAAERHEALFRKTPMPKPASFNESDVSDKPAWVRELPLLDEAEVARAEEAWRGRGSDPCGP
jgi:arylsulfatase A-like enzyme